MRQVLIFPLENCAALVNHGGTPLCNDVLSGPQDSMKYFTFTNSPFVNYFGHKTEEEAIYELSTHNRLIHLLILQQPYINKTNEVTECLNNIRFLLCNIYLPVCGVKSPTEYPITSNKCNNILGINCSTTISQLQKRGYNIIWPPVNIDCDKFPNTVPRKGKYCLNNESKTRYNNIY